VSVRRLASASRTRRTSGPSIKVGRIAPAAPSLATRHVRGGVTLCAVKVSAKADYAVRAAAELAAAQPAGALVRAEKIATAQGIPQRFLENILSDLRHAGLVQSQRGAEGGHRLNRPAEEISVADIIRAVDGPLAAVRGARPESVHYDGPAEPLQRVWIAVRKNLRDVVEEVSLADLAGGALPAQVNALADDPEAWTTR
jgi:Rrf2 family protein